MPGTLRVGDPAPDFTLKDQDGHVVRLSDYKDKQPVVLVFYPGDLTPGCIMQWSALRDERKKYDDTGVAVFGVNHGDADSHKKFIEKCSLPFRMLIDVGKKVSMSYGAVRSLFSVTIIRRTVVGIDKNGTVRFLKTGMPKTNDVLKPLKT